MTYTHTPRDVFLDALDGLRHAKACRDDHPAGHEDRSDAEEAYQAVVTECLIPALDDLLADLTPDEVLLVAEAVREKVEGIDEAERLARRRRRGRRSAP